VSNTKTRTAIEAGYNFHTDPHEPMVSIGLVAKVAGWEVGVTPVTAEWSESPVGTATILNNGRNSITVTDAEFPQRGAHHGRCGLGRFASNCRVLGEPCRDHLVDSQQLTWRGVPAPQVERRGRAIAGRQKAPLPTTQTINPSGRQHKCFK
jgi:hypothetical protein